MASGKEEPLMNMIMPCHNIESHFVYWSKFYEEFNMQGVLSLSNLLKKDSYDGRMVAGRSR